MLGRTKKEDHLGPSARNRAKPFLALCLTLAAGATDLIGYLAIYGLFTAHVTGTTVQLARSSLEHERFKAVGAAIIIGTFFLGSLLGRILIEIGARKGIQRIASITLLLEAVMIASVSRSPLSTHVQLALLAGAMGLQTATLTRVGALTVHTTFVTGMINKLGQLVSHVTFGLFDLLRLPRMRREEISAKLKKDSIFAAFIASIWIFYIGGAALGFVLFEQWGMRAFYGPAVLIAACGLINQVWPLSIEEEKEQSER